MKIIDNFLFRNEYDILEIRLSILYEHVDQFTIVESDHTFTGKYKGYNLLEHKERYKSLKTEQTAIDKLGELSNYRVETAKKIVEQSISNLWKGLFELKQQNNFNNGTTTQPRRTLDDQVNDLTARVLGINQEQSAGTTNSGNGIEEADWSMSE